MKYTLRKEQQEVVDYVYDNIGKRIALCCPTAFGKSILSYDIAQKYQGRTAIITYSNELIRQFTEEFPVNFLIGKSHYPCKEAWDKAFNRANEENVTVFNPITFLSYVKSPASKKFDCIIMDEADACLGLFQLADCDTFDFPFSEATVPNIKEAIGKEGNLNLAQYFFYNNHRFYWRVENVKEKGQEKRVVRVHPLVLSNQVTKFLNTETVILLSGTLLPSSCTELLGTDEYIYRELPSPIPVDRRKIYFHMYDEWEGNDFDKLQKLLVEVLLKYEERPAIVHTTYQESQLLAEVSEGALLTYPTKKEKMEALYAVKGTDRILVGGGATTGLNLIDDRCRLNIILRGAFANLGDDFVRRRTSIAGGQQWYKEQVLRHLIQACGRGTRTPDDFSRIVICDNRLSALIYNNKEIIPKYFLEAL